MNANEVEVVTGNVINDGDICIAKDNDSECRIAAYFESISNGLSCIDTFIRGFAEHNGLCVDTLISLEDIGELRKTPAALLSMIVKLAADMAQESEALYDKVKFIALNRA